MGNTIGAVNNVEMTNRRIKENYEVNKALNESEMYLTLDRADTAINETLRQGYWAKYKGQEQGNTIENKLMIHRGEGITAGNSAAREVRTFIGKEGRDLANIDAKVNAQIGNIWDKAQNQVNSLYIKTDMQYKEAKANMFTSGEAMATVGAGLLQDGATAAAIFMA